MNPPAWAYNPTLANLSQGSTSRPEPPIHPDRLRQINQGAQYVGRPPPHLQAQRSYNDGAHTHHRLPPGQSFRGNSRPARGRYPGSLRDNIDPRYTSRQIITNFPPPSKSAYPSMQATGLDSDGDQDRRKTSSRMSTMSARSSTRSGASSTPMRMVPAAGRFHLVDGEIVPIQDDSSDEDVAGK